MRRNGTFVVGIGAVTLLTLVALGGCKRGEAPDKRAASHAAESFGPSECAVCGMVVREQPAPRGQVVHRDGTRAHFCSLGDMVQYLRAPSPHGKVQASFVEVLDAGADPRQTSTVERPWQAAEQVSYVVGVTRSSPIMGAPVLTYPTRAAAERVAGAHGGRAQDWSTLQSLDATPRGHR